MDSHGAESCEKWEVNWKTIELNDWKWAYDLKIVIADNIKSKQIVQMFLQIIEMWQKSDKKSFLSVSQRLETQTHRKRKTNAFI